MVDIRGRGDVGDVVVELNAVGVGCADGISVGPIVVGVTGEASGARVAKCITTEEAAIGLVVGVFAPAPLRCTDPPVAEMGVKRTPKTTSAPPIPRNRVRLLRTLAPFFRIASPYISGHR
jgi:hypothetical protein